MKIAVLSDIHANSYACAEVQKDIRSQNVDLTVFLGDLVYGGIYPRECLAMLLDLHPLITIKGNADARFDLPAMVKSSDQRDYRDDIHDWVRSLMTDEEIDLIRGFKLTDIFTEGSTRIGFYHGSPQSYDDRIYDDDDADSVQSLFTGCDIDVALVGHTHVRSALNISGLRIYNPGAVGISNDTDVRAGYGVLTIDKGIRFEQRNLSYPLESYIEEIRTSTLPYKERLIEQIRTGRPNKSAFRPRR